MLLCNLTKYRFSLFDPNNSGLVVSKIHGRLSFKFFPLIFLIILLCLKKPPIHVSRHPNLRDKGKKTDVWRISEGIV